MSEKVEAAWAALEAARAERAKALLASAARMEGVGPWLRRTALEERQARQAYEDAMMEHLGAQINAFVPNDPDEPHH